MQTKEIRIIISEFESLSELSITDQKLVIAARKAAKQAYAPYSRFHVGAAVELDNGEIVTGNNQENAASPSGLCAERVALFYANSRFPDAKVNSIVVTAYNNQKLAKNAVSPCGACRQVMAETENRYQHDIRVILDGEKTILVFDNISGLLPFSFNPDALL